MRLKAPRYSPNWIDHVVLTDIEPRKLQVIGAISLQWNFVEDIIDDCLGRALQLDLGIAVDVTSRINGMDGKREILRKVVNSNPILNDEEKAILCDSIGAVAEYKKYRDGIVHARIEGPNKDVAFTAPNRGAAFYVIVATVALERLYLHLEVLGHEVIGMYRVVELCCVNEMELISEGGHIDPRKLRDSRSFLDAIFLARERQKQRRSLPPLPRFVDKPPTREGSEDPK